MIRHALRTINPGCDMWRTMVIRNGGNMWIGHLGHHTQYICVGNRGTGTHYLGTGTHWAITVTVYTCVGNRGTVGFKIGHPTEML